MAIHVYVGPTLAADQVLALVPEAVIRPPVAHGDLLRSDFQPGDVVVIIDGYYHQTGSVRHKELLALLADRVAVVGCASMGALRAAELHAYGMIGHGTVFQMYRDGIIDADDEVAVAHAEGPDYRRFGEPLVNIRHAVGAARDAGVLTAHEAGNVIAAARSLPYTSRAWRATEHAYASMNGPGSDVFGRLRDFLAAHPQYADIKAADAINTLSRLADLITDSDDRIKEWAASQSWRTKFLYEWQTAFAGTGEDIPVSHSDVLRYCQIYAEDFPLRWQRFALAQIAKSRKEPLVLALEHDPTPGALEAAAERGLTPDNVRPKEFETWLTRQEAADMKPEQALVRMLVRSYRAPRRDYDLVAEWPDLIGDAAIRAAVAECHEINAEVASWEAQQSINHIRHSVLRDHLAATWGIAEDDEEGLLAAARDRGFGAVEDAVAAVRPYFLRSHFGAEDSTPVSAEVS